MPCQAQLNSSLSLQAVAEQLLVPRVRPCTQTAALFLMHERLPDRHQASCRQHGECGE